MNPLLAFPDIPMTALAVVLIVAVLVFVGAIFVKNYVKVPPNMVAVFTGRGRQKIVRGGARFRVPGLERVDFMGLEPYNVEASVVKVYSKDNVPINLTAIGLIRFGSSDEMIATAVERFLTSDRNTLHNQVKEILAGNMRAIVSQMTVEELNGNRDELTRRVKEEAESSFTPIGMQLDVLTIQNISDENGYMDALGQRRTAEVKRDAAVGTAEAERETRIKSAAANQAAAEAEAVAATAVAEAEQRRDVRVAELKSETDAATARANQAGPLAEAQAQAAVNVAEAEAEQKREQARIAVEQQRALRAEQAQKADTIVPAEAAKSASILRAEGERQAAILSAEAEAETRRLSGQADADARKLAADATQAEMEAQANGEVAKLKATAEGTRELAEAQNAFTESAQRLQVLPLMIEKLPEIARAVADGIQIDNMVVMDGGGEGGGLKRAASALPVTMFQMNETFKALGIDISSFLPTLGTTEQAAEESGSAEVEPEQSDKVVTTGN